MVYINRICLLFSEKMTCFRGDLTRISELTMMVEHLDFFTPKFGYKSSVVACSIFNFIFFFYVPR